MRPTLIAGTIKQTRRCLVQPAASSDDHKNSRGAERRSNLEARPCVSWCVDGGQTAGSCGPVWGRHLAAAAGPEA